MVNSDPKHITAKQLRAARGWLGWTQQELSDRSKVSTTAIARFEREETVAYDDTLTALKETMEDAGIEFLFEHRVGVGVRRRG